MKYILIIILKFSHEFGNFIMMSVFDLYTKAVCDSGKTPTSFNICFNNDKNDIRHLKEINKKIK